MQILVTIAFVACASLLGTASNAAEYIKLPDDVATGWQRSWVKSLIRGYKSHGVKVVSSKDGHPVRMGKQSIRFEVRPGDCGTSPGWSDCKNDRERHEVNHNKDSYHHGDEFWFAWSIYLPKDFKSIFPSKLAMGQFHQNNGYPILMFQNGSGGYHADRQVPGGTTLAYTALSIGDDEMMGRWNDVVVNVKFSHNNDGHFNVFYNRKLK